MSTEQKVSCEGEGRDLRGEPIGEREREREGDMQSYFITRRVMAPQR